MLFMVSFNAVQEIMKKEQPLRGQKSAEEKTELDCYSY